MVKDNDQVIGIVSYLTIIGWVVALVLFVHHKNAFTRVHMRQALLSNLIFFIPVLGQIIWLLCTIYGIYFAAKGKKQEIPVIGNLANQLFGAL